MLKKNEVIKGLYLGRDAIDKTQSQTKEIIFIKKQIMNAIKFLEPKGKG